MKCQSGDNRQRVPGCRVDSGDDGSIWRNSRFKVILRFIEIPIGEVIETEIEFYDVVELFRDIHINTVSPVDRLLRRLARHIGRMPGRRLSLQSRQFAKEFP